MEEKKQSKNNILDIIENLFLLIGKVILFIMMFFTSVDALSRYLFNHPIKGGYEITQEYLLPILVFLTMSYVFTENGHVRVTLLTDKFSDKINTILATVFNIFAAIVFVLIAFGSYGRAIRAIQTNELSASVWAYPMAPAYFLVVAGSMLLAIRIVEAVIKQKNII